MNEYRKMVINEIYTSFEYILPTVLIQFILTYIPSPSIVVLGGYNGPFILRTCERFDPDKNLWYSFCSLPQPRFHALAIQMNENLFLIGGFNGIHAMGTTYMLNLTTSEPIWQIMDYLKVARISPCGWIYQNEIYIFGGYGLMIDNHRNYLKSGEKYSLKTSKWVIIKAT